MGNSCCHPDQANSKSAKLVDSTGNVGRVAVPITAAELMLDHPGNFVCSGDDLRRTRQILPIRANDEIMGGKLYMLVKAERVNCMISSTEMAVLDGADHRRSSMRRASCKVLPHGDGVVLNVKGSGISGHKLGKYWKPVLEPIFESC